MSQSCIENIRAGDIIYVKIYGEYEWWKVDEVSDRNFILSPKKSFQYAKGKYTLPKRISRSYIASIQKSPAQPLPS